MSASVTPLTAAEKDFLDAVALGRHMQDGNMILANGAELSESVCRKLGAPNLMVAVARHLLSDPDGDRATDPSVPSTTCPDR